MHLKVLIILLCYTIIPKYSFSQGEYRKPLKSENDIRADLFELPANEYNHIFQVKMVNDNFLLIDFDKMSYWPETNVLLDMFAVAKNVVQQTKDSFASKRTSKRIDIHVPEKNIPVEIRLTDHNDGTEMLVMNGDKQHPLKLGMDTIRILKTISVKRNRQNKIQRDEIQYTFILKDIEQISEISDNHELTKSIANTFDSVVVDRRNVWRNQDRWYREIGVGFTPAAKNNQLQVKKSAGFFKALDGSYYIGASLFRNTLLPYIDVGGLYKWPGKVGEYDYFRLSFNTMAQFERQSQYIYEFYNTAFVCAEVGTFINRPGTRLPVYETSIGFGYMLTNHPSLMPHKCMKMFWNYSLSPAVRFTPDLYVLFRKGTNNYVWPGITVSLKVF